MLYNKTSNKSSPKLSATILSQIFVWWLFPLISYARNHDVKIEDLYKVLPENLSEPLSNKLEKFWNKELSNFYEKRKKPSLLNAIRKTFGYAYVKYILMSFCAHSVLLCQPLVIGRLILNFSQQSTSTVMEGYGYALVMTVLTLTYVLLVNHIVFGMKSMGMRLRTACSALIYRKMLKLSNNSIQQVMGGKITSLLSNDVILLEQFFICLNAIWVVPLKTILILYLTWRNLGIIELFGICFLILQTAPVQICCGKIISILRIKIAMETDKRLLIVNEIIKGIRLIKMFTWENIFEQLAFIARKNEINLIAKNLYLRGVLWRSIGFSQRLSLYFTIIIYVLQETNLTAFRIFTLNQYLTMLHVILTYLLVQAIFISSESLISIQRIQELLLLEETHPNNKSLILNNNQTVIAMKDVYALISLDKSNQMNNLLYNINEFQIKFNKLYVVVGPVGAGKSSFLKLILGELSPFKGEISINGTVSYASQEPWLFNDSIKNNIIFGEAYDNDKYKRIMKACALLDDMEQLVHGDNTVTGEWGSALSGGQRARISLARALYRNADVYLLDDPLSSVDPKTAKHLFEECIKGLLKEKTCILVTHQLEYLKKADGIILINNGYIEYQGTLSNFCKDNKLFKYTDLKYIKEKAADEEQRCIKQSNLSYKNTFDEKEVEIDLTEENKFIENTEKNVDDNTKVFTKFKRWRALRISPYWRFIKAGSTFFLVFILFSVFIAAQILANGYDYFIAFWIKTEENSPINFKTNSLSCNKTISCNNLDSNSFHYILGFLLMGLIISLIVRVILFKRTCINASKAIHNKMISCILRTSMNFFATKDSGNILNRFSKDLGTVDLFLPPAMFTTFDAFLNVIASLLQVVLINCWLIFPISIFIVVIQIFTVNCFKIILYSKKLESSAKSLVYSHVNSSFFGITTIRSCKAQEIVNKKFNACQDKHTMAYSILLDSSLAFNLWLQILTTLFTTIVVLILLLLKSSGITGASVGLVITQVLMVCSSLSRGLECYVDLQTNMISVERILHYTELEEEEGQGDKLFKIPPKDWPSNGNIRFNHLYFKYSETSKSILKDLNFEIEAGTKVGIVGRTGAGKSSLIAALFRLGKIDGTIYIDDVDIKNIRLQNLRDKISVLTQEPILFSMSLKKNLDPLEKIEDDILWSALRDVGLDTAFDSLYCTFDPTSLSTGQRQLLCLARAILKKNRILVLDEATANIDTDTDIKIQSIIKDKLRDCTVLTIAHRLNSVIDSDKILVINDGRIVEYDSPRVLLQQKNSYCRSVLQQIDST